MHELRGTIHVHSCYSDGSGTVREITAGAARAGCDFVVLTDHDNRRACDDGWQGWRDGVLLVVGVEITCRDNCHVVVLGEAEVADMRFRPLRRVLFDLSRQGVAPFVAHAHPAHIMGYSLKAGPLHEWEVPGFTGVELWSLMHDVCDGLTPWRIPSFPYTWRRRIHGPHADTVAHWDRITRDRRFVAIGSLDNHAVAVPVVGGRIIPYEEGFRALRTHVLCKTLSGTAEDGNRLIAAIRAGRCFLALDLTADATGFRFEADAGGGRTLCMGEEHRWSGPVDLAVRSPRAARLRLLRNGEVAAEDEADRLRFRAETPGVYRAEAHLNGSPWVYTNPIYLRARPPGTEPPEPPS